MTARRRRIAHVITRLELGGAQQNTLHCVAHHDRDRYEVFLVAGRGGVLDADARAIPDAEIRLMPGLHHRIIPARDIATIVSLRNWFRERRIDLVHTHSSKAGLIGRIAARLAGVPAVVHTVHGWSFNPTQSAARRQLYVGLERFAAGLTDRMVTVSRTDLEDGLRHGIGVREKYEVIRSGIDADRFRRPRGVRETVRHGLGYRPEDFVVGTVACLKPQKAPVDFVTAVARARVADPSIKGFIAGDGELRREVEDAVAGAGLQDDVRLLGWRRDVPDLLQAMDLFLLTSHFEGLPRAVLQAMAAGVPVVATAVNGTPEVVVDGETGLLVPPGDPLAAGDAVSRMARDPDLRRRTSSDATARLTAEFDIDTMVRRLDDLYAELLAVNGTGSPGFPRRT